MPAPIPFFLLLCLIEFELIILLGERGSSREAGYSGEAFSSEFRNLPGNLLAYWMPLVVATAVVLFVAPAFLSGASLAILVGLVALIVFGRWVKQRWPGKRLNLYLVHLLALTAFVYFCFGTILVSGFLKSRVLPKAQRLNLIRLISTDAPNSCEFVALSDFHIRATPEPLAGLEEFSKPAQLQSLLANLPCKPKLLLVSGDLTDRGDPTAWAIVNSMFEKSTPGLTVLAAPGNHDIPERVGRGDLAGRAGAYFSFVAEMAPEIRTRNGHKLSEELDQLNTLAVTPESLKELQRKADEDWYVFSSRNWHGKPIGSPPELTLDGVMHLRQKEFWESLFKTSFPLFWMDPGSQTAVIILNSTSRQKDERTSFGDIDDDQIHALSIMLDEGLPSSVNTILILDHHPPTGRSDEILGSGPDYWWFPWAWRGTEIYEYGSLGSRTTSGQRVLAVLDKAVERRPNAEFAVISGHRHSLWIGKYGSIWMLDPPSLAREYSDPNRPFPQANRIIAGWHENGRLKIALLPKSNSH